jgi:hypothetical protein
MLENCTTEEQGSVVRVLWTKELNAKNIDKCFLLTVRSQLQQFFVELFNNAFSPA